MTEIATLARSYEEKVAAEPCLYSTIDKVAWLVEDTADRTWTPSEVGKALKITTVTAAEYLRELYLDGFIDAELRGAWTRYAARTR